MRGKISRICVCGRCELDRQELVMTLRFGLGEGWIYKFYFGSEISEMPVSYVRCTMGVQKRSRSWIHKLEVVYTDSP